jgi:hypothetical protein
MEQSTAVVNPECFETTIRVLADYELSYRLDATKNLTRCPTVQIWQKIPYNPIFVNGEHFKMAIHILAGRNYLADVLSDLNPVVEWWPWGVGGVLRSK